MQDADVAKLPTLDTLSGTLSERVHSAVKSAIMSLDFPPASVIRKTTICDRYGLSRSPVSDALSRLSIEGLVDIVPQSGSRVSKLSMTAIREGAFLREALEVATVRFAALHRSSETLAKLSRLVETQKRALMDIERDDFHRADLKFHETIMATTKISRLPATVRSVSQHLDRARVLLLPVPEHLSETLSEHIEILAALRAQDENRAQNAMRRHLGQLLERLAPLEATRPDIFSA